MLMMKKPKDLVFDQCTQKMCSLLPWYTEFPVYLYWKKCLYLCINTLIFYLPHMEYEGSIGFVSRKMKKIYC
jgi:hypothetical protein